MPCSRVSVTSVQELAASTESRALCRALVRVQMPPATLVSNSMPEWAVAAADSVTGVVASKAASRLAPAAGSRVAVPLSVPTPMAMVVGEPDMALPVIARFTVRFAGAPAGMEAVTVLPFWARVRWMVRLAWVGVPSPPGPLSLSLNWSDSFRVASSVVRPVKIPSGRMLISLPLRSRLVILASGSRRSSGRPAAVSLFSLRSRVVRAPRAVKVPAGRAAKLLPDRSRVVRAVRPVKVPAGRVAKLLPDRSRLVRAVEGGEGAGGQGGQAVARQVEGGEGGETGEGAGGQGGQAVARQVEAGEGAEVGEDAGGQGGELIARQVEAGEGGEVGQIASLQGADAAAGQIEAGDGVEHGGGDGGAVAGGDLSGGYQGGLHGGGVVADAANEIDVQVEAAQGEGAGHCGEVGEPDLDRQVGVGGGHGGGGGHGAGGYGDRGLDAAVAGAQLEDCAGWGAGGHGHSGGAGAPSGGDRQIQTRQSGGAGAVAVGVVVELVFKLHFHQLAAHTLEEVVGHAVQLVAGQIDLGHSAFDRLQQVTGKVLQVVVAEVQCLQGGQARQDAGWQGGQGGDAACL